MDSVFGKDTMLDPFSESKCLHSLSWQIARLLMHDLSYCMVSLVIVPPDETGSRIWQPDSAIYDSRREYPNFVAQIRLAFQKATFRTAALATLRPTQLMHPLELLIVLVYRLCIYPSSRSSQLDLVYHIAHDFCSVACYRLMWNV